MGSSVSDAGGFRMDPAHDLKIIFPRLSAKRRGKEWAMDQCDGIGRL
jgi:hypothetical protein